MPESTIPPRIKTRPAGARGVRPTESTDIPRPLTGSDERVEAAVTAVSTFVEAPLALLGQAKIEFRLDALAVNNYKRPVAEAIVGLVPQFPQIGAALNKLQVVGPLTALLEAVLPLVAQIAANHALLPTQFGEALGIIPKHLLIEELRRRDEMEREQAEATANGDTAA